METPPLPRSRLDELRRRFVIPKSMTDMFDDESTYADGARSLEYLLGRELLIPISLVGTVGEDVSLADYEEAARVYCYGHSPAMLETIDELLEELGKISLEGPRAANATAALAGARTRKITDADRGYIERLSELFWRRREMKEVEMERIVMGSAVGFILCAVIRVVLGVTGYIGDVGWALLGIVTLLLTMAFLISGFGGFDSTKRDFERRRELVKNDPFNQNPFRRTRMDSDLETWAATRWPGRGLGFYQIAGILVGGILFAMFGLLRPVLPSIGRTLGLAFPIFGSLLGAGISFALYNFRMRRSLKEIERACFLLCAAAKGGDEQDRTVTS
jgi:hypothetical protein